jgi:hypothetical protein
MDPQKFEAMPVRVDGAYGIAIATLHIDGRYQTAIQPECGCHSLRAHCSVQFGPSPARISDLPRPLGQRGIDR